MEVKFTLLRSNFLLLMVSMCFVLSSQTWAQSTTLEFEKATLVSKFAKYVGWPADAIQSEFIIGVYDDVEKYEYFRGFFANKGVKNKDIVVRLVTSYKDAKDVNILYISSPNKRNLLKLIDRNINDSNVLIVTENSKDLNNTMVDISYNQQQSTINLKVTDVNINDAGLTMPELSYFSDKNSEDVLSVSPTFALKTEYEKELLTLQKQLLQQKALFNQLNKKLNISEENSEKFNSGLQKTSERLKTIQEENAKKSEEIKSKDKKLQDLEKQLQTQLKMNKQESQVPDEVINNEQEQEQEQAIADLTEQLKIQEDITNNTAIKLSNMNKELTNITKENKTLSSFQMLFYIFVLIAVIALIIAFIMWKKAKSSTSQSSLVSDNESKSLLAIRESQLINSENFAALGYVATDITYAAGVSLADFQDQLESAGDTRNASTLKPVVTLLENFNLIAADQDDTEIQSFDLVAYMEKMVMLYDFEFNQSDIVYNYSGETALTIKSVPSYIALVLLNLINNSLKHGFDNNGNGKIALKVEKGVKSGAKITYSDDGKGMSKAILEQVFIPFFTTHSDRGYVGVGMSTTYNLIKNKLAGDIKIESQEGKGTTVTITLP